MLNNKFIVLFALGTCIRSNAMDQGRIGVVLEESLYGVVIQVHPGYISGTCIVEKKTPQEIARHEAALSSITRECKAINLIPVKDMGLWYMAFEKPLTWTYIRKLCADLPGLETVHSAMEYGDDKTGLKDSIYNRRLQELEANAKQKELAAHAKQQEQKQRDEKKTRLVTLKELSKGQLALPKEELVAE